MLQVSTFPCRLALTHGTCHTSIFTMAIWTEIVRSNSLTGYPRAVDKPCLLSIAHQVIQENGSSTMAKICIGVCSSTCGCRIQCSQIKSLTTPLSLQWDRIKTTKLVIVLLIPEKPSCLQTTVASVLSHPSWHTVPQVWPVQTSTRPSLGPEPPITLISPFEQSKG